LDVGTVSESSARVLYADANTLLRYAPTANYNGTLNDLITFKAWDRSGGYANGEAGVVTTVGTGPAVLGSYSTTETTLVTMPPMFPGMPPMQIPQTIGTAYGVAVSSDGSTAFVASTAAGLKIVDVRDPNNPLLLGRSSAAANARAVALSSDGQTAFVADGSNGLVILNVSNRAAPVVLGSIDTTGYANDVKLSADGRTAYIADSNSGLQIVDVHNAAAPILLGTYATTSNVQGIVVAPGGGRVYAATGTQGLLVIEVSTPGTPTLLGSYDTPNFSYDVAVSADGRTVYVADNQTGLIAVDVSTPSTPVLLGTIDTPLPGAALGVTLSADGRTAYIADSDNGLTCIDISSPNAMQMLTGQSLPAGRAFDVVLSPVGKIAFVADEAGGLKIVDVNTNPHTEFSTTNDTASLTVSPVNDAPVATGNAMLAAISEDTTNPSGATVSSLFGSSFSDSTDEVTNGSTANTLTGIAITGYIVDASKGNWQYSTDGGSNWTTLNSLTGDNQAVTLQATAMLRFVPTADYNGAAPTLTTRLIETPTAVTNGAIVDVGSNGGTTAVSAGTVVLSTSVTAVNDAPVANSDTGAVNEDATLSKDAANGVVQGSTGGSVADSDVDNTTSSLLVSGAVPAPAR